MPLRKSVGWRAAGVVGVGLLLGACANVQTGGDATGGRGAASGGATEATGGKKANGAGGSPSSTGGNDHGTGGDAFDAGVITKDDASSCGLTKFMVERTPSDLLLLLDRSGSMMETPGGGAVGTSKWQIVTPALSGVITATDAALSWALKTFPEGEGSECAAGSVTSAIDVPMAAMNAGAVNGAIAATMPRGNGTPTGDAVNQAAAYLEGLNDGARHAILLATDGEPSCPTGSTAAATYAVQAVTDAAAKGINTYVVGIATTKKTSTATLNMLAVAGGVPTGDPAAGANQFYLASTPDDLLATLKKITGQVASCDFKFDKPPLAPENIAVDVEGTRLHQSDTDGWSYADAGYHGIRINGPSCEKIQKASSSAIQITFGCPDIVIP